MTYHVHILRYETFGMHVYAALIYFYSDENLFYGVSVLVSVKKSFFVKSIGCLKTFLSQFKYTLQRYQ